MSAGPETDADEAAAFERGQHIYWRGEPYPALGHTTEQSGWRAAAEEARRALEVGGQLLLRRGAIKEALEQAGAAIRALRPANPRPSQRDLAKAALSRIDQSLNYLAPRAERGTNGHAAAGSGGR